MTKIITSENRIIFDGHARTKEECETISLMCEELAKSNKFKTVKYEHGYAEFEKVGTADDLKFLSIAHLKILSNDGSQTEYEYHNSEPFSITVTSTGCTSTITDLSYTYSGTGTFRGFATSYNQTTVIYGIGATVSIPKQPAITYLYVVDIPESTPKVNVDLTTLAGWEALSSGTHNITIVAKANGYRDSEPSAAVQVEKDPAVVMPNKGDIITLDSKQYRVLKTEGTVAEVLCMYDANSSIKFDTNSDFNNTYAGKNIDTYCNNTFYNGLSAAMKSAIVDKTFTQDSWTRDSSAPTASHYTGKHGSSTYYLTLANAAFGISITRHCYCLSVQDVLDYLEATTSMGISDTTLTDTNVWRLFWNVTTSQSDKSIWLSSAGSSYFGYAFSVYGSLGNLDNRIVSDTRAVRPAFQIDLSKISWSK